MIKTVSGCSLRLKMTGKGKVKNNVVYRNSGKSKMDFAGFA